MPYRETKVYYDGSHYIALPPEHFQRAKRRRKPKPIPNPDTRKEKFETAYSESKALPKRERKDFITEKLKDTFSNEEETTAYVERNIERKKINAAKRRTRLMRKVYLQQWNFFVTFTYDNALHTKHFGRNDFERLTAKSDVMQSVRYLLKYIEKSGEKLIYGGKLPAYFISDILDEDIICGYDVDEYLLKGEKTYRETTYVNEGNIYKYFNSYSCAEEYLPPKGKDFTYLERLGEEEFKKLGSSELSRFYDTAEPYEFRHEPKTKDKQEGKNERRETEKTA